MTTVTLTVTPAMIDKPAGKTGGDWRIGLTISGSIAHEYYGPAPTCAFINVIPGAYSAFAERRAVEGGQIGPSITQAVDVPASVPGAEQVEVAGAIAAVFS